MAQLEMVFGDPHLCTGCMVCVNTCSMYYFKVIGPEWARVRVRRIEPGLDFPLFCRNCDDAPCIEACPNDALFRTRKGIVMVNNKKCDGTGACITACPYSSIHLNPDTGKAIKCIQCGECIERCPADAIWMTTQDELDEKDSDKRLTRLYEKHADHLYGGRDQ